MFFAFFVSVTIGFLPLVVCAQDVSQKAPEEKQPVYEEYSPQDVPEGMEVVAVTGGYKLIVPKGSKLRKVGAQIIVEGQKEYMSRHFEEMRKRFDEVTATIEELKEEIKVIKGEKPEASSPPAPVLPPKPSDLSSPLEDPDAILIR